MTEHAYWVSLIVPCVSGQLVVCCSHEEKKSLRGGLSGDPDSSHQSGASVLSQDGVGLHSMAAYPKRVVDIISIQLLCGASYNVPIMETLICCSIESYGQGFDGVPKIQADSSVVDGFPDRGQSEGEADCRVILTCHLGIKNNPDSRDRPSRVQRRPILVGPESRVQLGMLLYTYISYVDVYNQTVLVRHHAGSSHRVRHPRLLMDPLDKHKQASLLSVAVAQNSTNGTSPQLVVMSNAGMFAGQYSSPTVRNWLGIKYGAAPTGKLRFRPPRRAEILPPNEVFNATSYSPGCPQNRGPAYVGFKALTLFEDGSDGEDCLSLNIWSPSLDRLRTLSAQNSTGNSSSEYAGTAVLVWIFGGAFTFGQSNVSFYNGNNFVQNNEDITVVTLNYRTNIFGFPNGSPAINPYQVNNGLADQRLAIEWVYNNIAAFGGDPERITLFGESAGASSIGAYPYAYEYDPIVKGLIMESGSEFLMVQELASNDTLNTIGWNTIANASGCPLPTNGTSMAAAASQLTCMQSVEWQTIQSAYLIWLSTLGRLASGQFAQVPVFIGSNNDEGSILVALTPNVPPELITTYGFTCPAAAVATGRENLGIPSYQYRFLADDLPQLNPPQLASYGAYHSSEIPLVFGTYNSSPIMNTSSETIALSRDMQTDWVAFARNPASGLVAQGVPLYQSNGTTLLQFGINSTTPVSLNSSQAYNSACGGYMRRKRSLRV
ncbi:hypothetical protein MRB53_040535 [Persea americana]|nr:hypothetical protein MRB53_040535 [Persea americana]